MANSLGQAVLFLFSWDKVVVVVVTVVAVDTIVDSLSPKLQMFEEFLDTNDNPSPADQEVNLLRNVSQKPVKTESA